MSRLGVTPTIQTLKEFEGIASLEEVTDGTFGAPTVKLGAYMLQEPEPENPAFQWGAYMLTEPCCKPPRVPTPEMAPMLDAMVIDVLSEEEEDTVSLGEEEAPIPEGSGLFGDDEYDAPLPQGLKLNLDDDTSDYGDDPEMLCSPIPVPAPVAGPVRISRCTWETRGPQPYKHWLDDHDTYEGLMDNELVPFCSHKGTLLTDPTLASISLDIGRLLDKYLAANIQCGFVLLCADCKDTSKSNFIQWIVDSGASVHFMDNKADFSDLRFFDEKNWPQAQTANGTTAIHSHGTVFLKTWVDTTTSKTVTISRLSLVFYMPGMGIRLLCMGLLLKGNMQIKGDEHRALEFIEAQTGKVKIVALTRLFTDTIYWVNSEVLTGSELTTHKSMHRDDYDLWHR